MDPDPGGPKTCGSGGSGSATLIWMMVCRVSMSSVFPGREKDWVEFGTFLYEDERTIQTFKNEEGILGKYIKVRFINKIVRSGYEISLL
jgi:hypothetical protein